MVCALFCFVRFGDDNWDWIFVRAIQHLRSNRSSRGRLLLRTSSPSSREALVVLLPYLLVCTDHFVLIISSLNPIHYIGHPFDLTKTRLQTAAPGTYTGAIDVVKKTVARDGFSGYAFPLCPSPST